MNPPRVLIGGLQSGVGKTTISIGIMSALMRRGFKVQPFKVGPDYIDTSYHRAATRRPSRNLDGWMIPTKGLLEIFQHACRDTDIAVIEGVMGLYDGLSGTDERGSTAQIAKILRCPVILVVDAEKMARTCAAVVLGCKSFDVDLQLSGVILNNIAGRKHAEWCTEAIEASTGIPVIGAVPRDESIKLPERHLGLIPTTERSEELNPILSRITALIENNVDLDKVVEISKSGGELPGANGTIYPAKASTYRATIGVAFDEAFNFYYQDNLDILEAYGARLIFFSPIRARGIPEGVDGLYIGGGFPEVLPRELEANGYMRKSLKRAAEDGLPIYAECGGLMYLTDYIQDYNGRIYKMVGLLPSGTVMTRRLTLNYTEAETVRGTLLCDFGRVLRGHEFHYSQVVDVPVDAKFAYVMKRGVGIDGRQDGWIEYNILASYMHVHFGYDAQLAQNFIEACRKYSRR